MDCIRLYLPRQEWALSLFSGSDATLDPKAYIPIGIAQTKQSIGWDVTGIISAMCAPLSLAGIPLLNVSTFTTDFTLVQEDSLQLALNAFERS